MRSSSSTRWIDVRLSWSQNSTMNTILLDRSPRRLAHPATAAALGLLLVNDHLLRRLWPSWFTGKLGDVAWLYCAVALAGVASVVADRLPLSRRTRTPRPRRRLGQHRTDVHPGEDRARGASVGCGRSESAVRLPGRLAARLRRTGWRCLRWSSAVAVVAGRRRDRPPFRSGVGAPPAGRPDDGQLARARSGHLLPDRTG